MWERPSFRPSTKTGSRDNSKSMQARLMKLGMWIRGLCTLIYFFCTTNILVAMVTLMLKIPFTWFCNNSPSILIKLIKFCLWIEGMITIIFVARQNCHKSVVVTMATKILKITKRWDECNNSKSFLWYIDEWLYEAYVCNKTNSHKTILVSMAYWCLLMVALINIALKINAFSWLHNIQACWVVIMSANISVQCK